MRFASLAGPRASPALEGALHWHYSSEMLVLLPCFAIATVLMAAAAEGPCPATDDVEAELGRLGASSALSDQRSVEVSVQNGRMRVVLRDRLSGASAAREVAAPSDCHERALVVAVLVAAWSTPWKQEEPTLQQQTPPDRKAPEEVFEAPRKTVGELAAFGFGAGDGNAVAGSIGAEGGVRLGGAVLAGVAQMTSPRDRVIGSASATYSSLVAGVSLGWHHDWGNWWARPELAALAVRWSLQGKDLSISHSATDWGFGLDGRLRFGVAFANWAPFAFVALQRTITREQLVLDNRPDATDVPAWNLGVGLGLAFFFRHS